MKYKELVGHFGGPAKIAEVLESDRRTVHAWGYRGRIPSLWQLKAAALSEGKLKADRKAIEDAAKMAAYANGTVK